MTAVVHAVEVYIANALTKGAGSNLDRKQEFALKPAEGKSHYVVTGVCVAEPQAALICDCKSGGKFNNPDVRPGSKTEGVVAYTVPGGEKLLVIHFEYPAVAGGYTVKIGFLPARSTDTPSGLLKKLQDSKESSSEKIETGFVVDSQGYKVFATTKPSITATGTLLVPVTLANELKE